jgi:hypothetical protein
MAETSLFLALLTKALRREIRGHGLKVVGGKKAAERRPGRNLCKFLISLD